MAYRWFHYYWWPWLDAGGKCQQLCCPRECQRNVSALRYVAGRDVEYLPDAGMVYLLLGRPALSLLEMHGHWLAGSIPQCLRPKSFVRMRVQSLRPQGKQKLYEEQLQQVEEALKQEETEDLQRLRADLQEVIQLTKHLVEYKQQQDRQPAETQAAETLKESATKDAHPASASREQAAAPAEVTTAAVPATHVPEQPAGGGPLVGRTCSAEYEGKRYYASIVEVKRDPKVRLPPPVPPAPDAFCSCCPVQYSPQRGQGATEAISGSW